MKKILVAMVLAAALMSCTNVNERIGGDFIATNQQYDFHTAEFNLDEVWMKAVDSLSGYSSRRINFGAIRDETYGLFRRGCAVTLVPVLDSVYLGENPTFKRFKFQAARDSVSVADMDQSNILQSVYVYEVTEALDPAKYFSRSEVKHGSKTISKGIPILNGSDSLTFDFTAEYGKKYMSLTQSDMKDFATYSKKFPGIYLETNDPVGFGGRFNLFNLNILESAKQYVYRTNNYALLYYTGTYNGERKDTTLMFYFSPLEHGLP